MNVFEEIEDQHPFTLLGTVEEFQRQHASTLKQQKLDNYGEYDPSKLGIEERKEHADERRRSVVQSRTSSTNVANIAPILNTLNRNRELEKKMYEEKLSKMTYAEKIQEESQGKVLNKHQETLKAWDTLKNNLSMRVGRDKHDSVIESSETFRMQSEFKNVLENVKPIEHRVGEHAWLLSLRDCQEIEMDMNGISCPISYKFNPGPVAMVRKPGYHPKVHPKSIINSKMAAEALKKRKSDFDQVQGYVPTDEDFDKLVVEGIPLLTTEKLEKTLLETLHANKDSEFEDHESMQFEANETIQKNINRIVNLKKSFDETLKEKNPDEGPMFLISSTNIFLKTGMNETTDIKQVSVENKGTTVLFFTWSLPNVPFYLQKTEGMLLPGETKTFDIVFRPSKEGSFQTEIQFLTKPVVYKIAEAKVPFQPIVHISGVCNNFGTAKTVSSEFVHDFGELLRKIRLRADISKFFDSQILESVFTYKFEYEPVDEEQLSFSLVNRRNFPFIKCDQRCLKVFGDIYKALIERYQPPYFDKSFNNEENEAVVVSHKPMESNELSIWNYDIRHLYGLIIDICNPCDGQGNFSAISSITPSIIDGHSDHNENNDSLDNTEEKLRDVLDKIVLLMAVDADSFGDNEDLNICVKESSILIKEEMKRLYMIKRKQQKKWDVEEKYGIGHIDSGFNMSQENLGRVKHLEDLYPATIEDETEGLQIFKEFTGIDLIEMNVEESSLAKKNTSKKDKKKKTKRSSSTNEQMPIIECETVDISIDVIESENIDNSVLIDQFWDLQSDTICDSLMEIKSLYKNIPRDMLFEELLNEFSNLLL
eukprot:TRINITY_DN2755_c0_g1_i1.p1 TRINITY_DN2755_c0_g1~~TRINITY_DN2755_c0_g1_i1.p1  ORF type:complete len:835 (+),score=217.75 TRINITY_DN2755_c0_g1_i1:43-2505(+)